jgi:DNA-binding NarL/FixJ family response regulator
MKILLLDDHPLIIDFIAEQIIKIDSDVLVMTSIGVEQALDILSAHKIDRVVCDLQIKSGKSVAVPEYCAKHNIPFMVFSSYVNNSLIHTLKSLNVNCYVSKAQKLNT